MPKVSLLQIVYATARQTGETMSVCSGATGGMQSWNNGSAVDRMEGESVEDRYVLHILALRPQVAARRYFVLPAPACPAPVGPGLDWGMFCGPRHVPGLICRSAVRFPFVPLAEFRPLFFARAVTCNVCFLPFLFPISLSCFVAGPKRPDRTTC